MATPRLTFLYPNFFRAVRSCEPTTYRSLRAPPKTKGNHKSRIHTTSRRTQQETYSARYGPAALPPLPPPPKPSEPLNVQQQRQAKDKEAKKEDPNSNPEVDAVEPPLQKTAEPTQYVASADVKDSATGSTEPAIDTEGPLENKELDIVLSIPTPSEIKGEAHRHPHLEASMYEHHFDTYSLVRDLASQSAYTEEQAVTLMKAIRLMLAVNLDIAKEGLVSKSDVENEAYLFRAACSELRTTLQTTRHSETLKQRSQRAALQHEYDLLNQKFTQDLITMREDLKGQFNDRKLRLGEDKRKIDTKISELNYEITVLLNSEAKSEVEGLRWVLTRRAAMAIGAAAFMIIASLNYSSMKGREKEEAAKKIAAAQKIQQDRAAEAQRYTTSYTTPSRGQGTQTDGPPGKNLYEESLG